MNIPLEGNDEVVGVSVWQSYIVVVTKYGKIYQLREDYGGIWVCRAL